MKKNLILVYSGLRYTQKNLIFVCKFFFENCSFEYKNRFAVKKKTQKKILGQFQYY